MHISRSSVLSGRNAATALAAAAVLLSGAAPACAQAGPPPELTARTRAAVVDSAAAHLARAYVDADTARMIADAVRARLRAGAYDTLTTPERFAEAVTRDLRSVNGDLHLSLSWDPRQASPLQSGGPGGPPPAFVENARRQNFGLGRVEILPGNVGYLEITGFMGAPGYERAVGDALRLLERTDAVIVDVRRNGGGSGEMSHLVFSHFLPAEPVPTIRVVERATGEDVVQRSVAEVPGPRRPDVPLYVLTSRATGSAAEEFSFVLKNQGRATIVGDRTAGAGHMVGGFGVGHGFVVGVSITRVTDPRTGLEWERVGVQPDVRVPSSRALDAAHAAAARAIAAKTEDAERRAVLQRLAEISDAKARGQRGDPAVAAAAAGTYEGNRVVEADGGRIWYRRAGLPGEELVPLGGGRYALGAVILTFDTTGPQPRIVAESPDGSRRTYVRTSTSTEAPTP